jgi:glycosyltransferase involved in cell wall biosynthesis
LKILILTQYFPPEVGAPQNRLYELAIRLQKKGAEISILTAMPNYPQMKIHREYKGKLYSFEMMNDIKVYRSYIFVSKKKAIGYRLLNYFSFVFSSLITGLFKLGKFDYILCESPPLFLGISAYLLNSIKGSKMIFNVSDLWPESAEKLGLVKNKFLLNISTNLEELLYKKSSLITGQTQGIVKNISSRFPDKKVYWLPNGVDLELFNSENKSSDWRSENGFKVDDFILLYAGIIGYAQGLEIILKTADKMQNNPKIKFVILGNGPEKEKLLHQKEIQKLSTVYFFDSIPKSSMQSIINGCNVALIPLKKLDLFKGAIPSKIFENLAMKKPILLGVEGEAKELFIDEGRCGLAYEPEDSHDLTIKIFELYNNTDLLKALGENGFKYVQTKFTRNIIADNFWKELIALETIK